MLKVIEAFGGIGACTQALKNIGIDFEVVDYIDNDKYSVRSYNAINDTNFEPQDIRDWDKQIDVDFFLMARLVLILVWREEKKEETKEVELNHR